MSLADIGKYHPCTSAIFSMRWVHRANSRAIAMMFVHSSVCLSVYLSVSPSGMGMHCDHTVQFSADLSLQLDNPMF